jgi:hypothetical protein
MTTGLSALPTRLRGLSPPTGVCPCDLFKLGAPSPPLCLVSKIGNSMTLGALLDRRSMGDTTAQSSNERERSLAVPCQDRYFSSPRSPRIRAPRARSSIESLGAPVVHCALTARTPRRIFDTPRAFASHIVDGLFSHSQGGNVPRTARVPSPEHWLRRVGCSELKFISGLANIDLFSIGATLRLKMFRAEEYRKQQPS